jgi:hypothetical protein
MTAHDGQDAVDAVEERLLRPYTTEGEASASRRSSRARLAGEAGLDEAEDREMLGQSATAEARALPRRPERYR